MINDYILQSPNADKASVNAWSTSYIPFEPKGWLRDMREDMKKAIGLLTPDSSALYACYISSSDLFCDVENVLFYNIGTGAFTNLASHGIFFERGFDNVPPCPEQGFNAAHYYHYTTGAGFRLWEEEKTLASWNNVALSPPSSSSKPHTFWYSMKRGTVNCAALGEPSRFGLSIELLVPETARCNPTSLMKPLLDGVISAFHHQDSSPNTVAIERLSALTGAAQSEITKYLSDSSTSVLGTRSLVLPYRDGIIWNPQDDACVACSITVCRDKSRQNWGMSGKIFSVQPRR